MTTRTKIAGAAAGAVLAVAGVVAGVTLTNENETATPTTHTAPYCMQGYEMHADGLCYAAAASGTTTVDPCLSPSVPCAGDTFKADAQPMAAPQQSSAMLFQAKNYLKLTSISGITYHNNDLSYKGSNWWQAISSLLVGQAAAPAELRGLVDAVGQRLVLTNISGKKYFANPAKYKGGNWDEAMKVLDGLIDQVKLYSPRPPTITIQKKPAT